MAAAYAALAASPPFATPAHAGIVVHATRVVYPAGRREVTVELNNDGTAPSLVQAWIDDGSDHAGRAKHPVPFAVTPAIFRVDPGNGQSLRIMYTGRALPADRETVFWLNVLDIPPKAPVNPDAPNRLDFAFRHRMKLFFRPASLPGKAQAAATRIGWTLGRAHGQPAIVATNPSPYHVSLTRLEAVHPSGESSAATPAMLAPFSTAAFPLPATAQAQAARIRFEFVDDFGARQSAEVPVQPGHAGK